MKSLYVAILCSLLLSSCAPMYPTHYPDTNDTNNTENTQTGPVDTRPVDTRPVNTDPGRSADRNVKVLDIRLTNQYTILSLRVTNTNRPRYDQRTREMIDDGRQRVAFRSTALLIAAEGAREFRFIRADNIPMDQSQSREEFDRIARVIPAGQSLDFTVYFERLDKGLEDFDLFECNDFDHMICWNIYGLHVKNPIDPVYVPQPTKKPSGKVGEVDNTPKETPVLITNVSGLVREVKTQQPISATIDYHISASKQKIDSVQSFANTGSYKLVLPKGQVYTYTVSARGYVAVNEVLDLRNATKSVTRDIYLTPFSVGDKITLKNIYFEVSKSELLSASYAELNKLVAMMNENPRMKIRLEGHTDVVGDHDANLELSQERVDACRTYLIQHGINASRVKATGYGDTRPIIKKGTDEERKVNRRVEFIIEAV